MNGALLDLETSDGVAIAAHRRPVGAAPSGTTVVIAHGFAATGTEARVTAVADALADRGHAVLTFDSRGHGASGGEATLGNLEALDIAAVVDASGSDRVVLVGASMGAIGVLRYTAEASRTTEVAGVVTVSCPARWRLPRNARGLLSALMTQTPFGRWARAPVRQGADRAPRTSSGTADRPGRGDARAARRHPRHRRPVHPGRGR